MISLRVSNGKQRHAAAKFAFPLTLWYNYDVVVVYLDIFTTAIITIIMYYSLVSTTVNSNAMRI